MYTEVSKRYAVRILSALKEFPIGCNLDALTEQVGFTNRVDVERQNTSFVLNILFQKSWIGTSGSDQKPIYNYSPPPGGLISDLLSEL
jgi:hypothetical protein